MAVLAFSSPASKALGLLLVVATTATPSLAASATQARLVRCGADTCLRLSGHRLDPAVAIGIAGDDLAVEGGHNWRVTVPLSTARVWAKSSASVLTLTLTDARNGTESSEAVALPPGAFGQRVELASLVVRAH